MFVNQTEVHINGTYTLNGNMTCNNRPVWKSRNVYNKDVNYIWWINTDPNLYPIWVIGPDSCIDEGMGSVQYQSTFNQYYFVVYIYMNFLFDSCTQGMPKVADQHGYSPTSVYRWKIVVNNTWVSSPQQIVQCTGMYGSCHELISSSINAS